ncbi:acyltransferase [Pseudofrankia asymbiotica]|uniref:Acetyltransferase n=1 Tax=Pseudofrankia asymbiotica TaxID=1834516 RepID=A0A1V2I9F4_9ACTN|nr:acyltransferase [Pseudofrankia asymbiotica]ONH28974.1 acetyltransferase [Pseudofrankia asymbiotica]
MAREIARDVVLNGVAATPLAPRPLRARLLRATGMRVEAAAISPGCWFGGRNVSIGPRTYVNRGCFFDTLADVAIGADCHLGMQVLLCTSTHEPGDGPSRAGAVTGRPIVIGDGCWVGARVTVMPGVTIKDGCVIAAGAVVTGDCEPDGLYAGIPARRVRDLPPRSGAAAVVA